MRFLIGLIGIITGLAIIKYQAKIKEFTGDIGFAEHYLGNGGTYTFILLLGCGTVILSILYATGTIQEILANFLRPYF